MEIKTIEDAKNYLSAINDVIIPKEYTYFLHCTAFELPEEAAKSKYNKSWTELPLNNFRVRWEMSFVERKDRVNSALQYGGLHKAMTSYAKAPNSKPFQIRVIMPKFILSDEEKIKLDITPDEAKILYKAHTGGDGRHPKLFHDEVIEIFATSIIDEVTETQQDIFYGVRQQDLVRYAQLVSEELELQKEIPREQIPTNMEEYYVWNDSTFSLPKNKNNYRYQKKYISDKEDNIQLLEYSDFEQDYLNELAYNQETTKTAKR